MLSPLISPTQTKSVLLVDQVRFMRTSTTCSISALHWSDLSNNVPVVMNCLC